MGTVTKRVIKDGTIRYRAQIRITREGLPPFAESRTFSKISLANEWIKRREADIEINPAILQQEIVQSMPLKILIKRYLEEVTGFADNKSSALNHICTMPIAGKDVYTLLRQDFSEFAIARKNGDDEKDGVAPATIKKDLSHIGTVLNHAELVWGLKLEQVIIEFEASRKGLTKARIIRKSIERDRLPTTEELQQLTDYFYKRWRRLRNTIPMHLVIWYAIYTCRRQDELCNLLITDYDEANQQWKLRDIKHPDGSEGNNKFGHLEPLAIDMIPEFLKPDVRERMALMDHDQRMLIPVQAQSVSSTFTRACQICGIEDLTFHDLRHEGATRLAENGFTIPQIQMVTLHESWNTLKRYVNMKKRGKRIDFREALANAEKRYDDYYSEWRTKQRYLSKMDKIS
jgi:integrase